MSTGSENLSLKLQVEGARKAQSEIQHTSDKIDKLGNSAKRTGEKQEKSGRKAHFFSRRTHESGEAAKTATGHFKRMALAMGGMALGWASFHGAEKAIHRTVELTAASAGLTRVFGLSATSASQYAVVADTLGVDQKALSLGLTMLSKNVQAATGQYGALDAKQAVNRKTIAGLHADQQKLSQSTKDRAKHAAIQAKIETLSASSGTASAGKQADAFKRLGVSVAMLKRGNADEIFKTAAEGLKGMKGGTEKAALQMMVFGKGAAKLGPMLAQGGKGIEEWQKKSADAAKHLDPKKLAAYREEQRASKLMWTELSVTVGEALLPRLVKAEAAMLRVMHAFKEGKGAAGEIKAAFKALASAGGAVVDAFQAHPKLMTRITGALLAVGSAVWIVNKATKAWTAVQAAFNIVMSMNPIVAMVLAAVALGVLFVVMYKKVGWFRKGVNAAWHGIKVAFKFVVDFIRDHWKAIIIGMLGPVGLLVVGIATHWDSIQTGFGKMIDWMKDAWDGFARGLNVGIDAVNGAAGTHIGHIPLTPGRAGTALPSVAGSGQFTFGGSLPKPAARPAVQMQSRASGLGGRFAASMAAGGVGGSTVIPVHIDGREVARAVVNHGKRVGARG